MRQLSLLDSILGEADHLLRTVWAKPTAVRKNPAYAEPQANLSQADAKHVAGLMRVDHTGEICAQALYRGQACVAKDAVTRERLLESAGEENDHLAWCEDRLVELNSHPSYLNLFWYIASLQIGIAAGLAGDQWSLGFVVETENQVMKHLEAHLLALPAEDQKSRAILKQMHVDEGAHASHALLHGAKTLPLPVKLLMAVQSKVMTKTAYWI
jgi:ubiquinone biosynthesis monooxygenase Coq7